MRTEVMITVTSVGRQRYTGQYQSEALNGL